jgi:ketosteroid isomerase-like protein
LNRGYVGRVTGPDSDAEDVVRRYFAVVADLESSEDDLRAVVAPDAEFVEWPNPISPQGHRRTAEDVLGAFQSGKALLSAQSIEVHDVLVLGERVATRSTWRGTVGIEAGPLKPGDELVAHMAGFITVRDGMIAEHETYDCYEPFGS